MRDKGVPAAAGALSVLPWQGSSEATFAALQGVQADDGGGVLCPSIACIKWWTEPAGDLHADVRGEIAGGYVDTAPEIAARIVAARSTLEFAPGAIAAAVAARSAACGWRIENESSTAADAISDLLGGVSLSWVLVGRAIDFRRWEWTAPIRIARSHRVTRRQTFKPVTQRKLGYRRNWAPMARGDLAAIVLATDVTYGDGTPVEDLKPAEPGATNSADPASPLGQGGTVGSVLDGIERGKFAQIIDIATTETNRLRDRALNFPGPEGETVYTLHVREVTERKTEGEVFAERFELLGAVDHDRSAFVLNADTVRITPGETMAQRFNFIAATVGASSGRIDVINQVLIDNAAAAAEVDASIQQINRIVIGPAGADARAMLVLNVNGKISGFASTNDGTISEAVFAVDRFRLEDPETGKAYLYADDTGTVRASNVVVDTLEVGSVGFDAMQLGAAVKTAWTQINANVQIPQGQTLAVFELSFIKEDTDSAIELITFLNAKSPDDLQFDVTLQIDGMVMQAVPGVNLILDTANSQAQMPITPMTIVSGIAAGQHTVSVKVYNRETDNVPLTIQVGSFLKVAELRKAAIGSSSGSGEALPPPNAAGGSPGGDYVYRGGRV